MQLADDAGGELYMKFASALGETTEAGAPSGILAPDYQLRAVANVRADLNLWPAGVHTESGTASATVTLTLAPASP